MLPRALPSLSLGGRPREEEEENEEERKRWGCIHLDERARKMHMDERRNKIVVEGSARGGVLLDLVKDGIANH